MAQKWPFSMSVNKDVNEGRPPFRLARRSQVASDWHSDALVKSQVAAFLDHKARTKTPPSASGSGSSGSVYAPLVALAWAAEIRVFELLPAKFGEPIRGSLHHVLVDFSVEREGRPTDFAVSESEAGLVFYTALSYVWGSSDAAKKKCKIEVDRKSIEITKSLDTAIRYLRDDDDSVMIWADQVCINQEDLAERAAQIQLMYLIYSRALKEHSDLAR